MADEKLTLLQEKWRSWFDWLDVNGDGALTSADWTKGAETMIQEHDLDEDHAVVAMASYRRIGSMLLGENMKNQKAVTVDEFVDNLTKFYEHDNKEAGTYIFNVMRQLFLVADVNRDSLIDEKEFTILMNSFGMKRENASRFYREFKQWKKGKVPLQEAINWWVDVWFGTDKEQWEKIKTML